MAVVVGVILVSSIKYVIDNLYRKLFIREINRHLCKNKNENIFHFIQIHSVHQSHSRVKNDTFICTFKPTTIIIIIRKYNKLY